MTPTQAIARLDRQLSRHGTDATLRRPNPSGNPIDGTVRISIRGYEPSDLVGGIVQGDSLAVVSPTTLTSSGWTAATGSAWPRKGDKVLYAGRLRNVEAAEPRHIDGTLVRVDLQLRG